MRRPAFALLGERRRRRKGARAGINLVSLMDIFTILVFFLLVNAGDMDSRPAVAGLRLPEAQAEASPPAAPTLWLDGREARLDGRVVATLARQGPAAISAALAEALAPAAAQSEDKRLLLLGDRSVPYRTLRAVLEGATRAGFRQVLLAVETEGGHG